MRRGLKAEAERLAERTRSQAHATSIATKYQVSQDMARFRLNTSGVLLQARRARAVRVTDSG